MEWRDVYVYYVYLVLIRFDGDTLLFDVFIVGGLRYVHGGVGY